MELSAGLGCPPDFIFEASQTTDNDLSHTLDVVARSEKGQRVIIDNFILHTLGQRLLGVEESSN